jgi:hypothetical protein
MSTSMTRTRSLSPFFIIAVFASAIVLLANALKRAGIALGPVTQLAAPLAQVLAIGLVVGIFAATPAVRGRLGSIGAALCAASLVLLVGVELVINLVFPSIPPETVSQLSSGPLGVAFTVSSISFLLGTLVFFTALWRVVGSPRFAILLAVASSVTIALRTAFPEVVLQGGIGGLAGAVALLVFWLIRSRRTRAADLLGAG